MPPRIIPVGNSPTRGGNRQPSLDQDTQSHTGWQLAANLGPKPNSDRLVQLVRNLHGIFAPMLQGACVARQERDLRTDLGRC